MDRTPVNSATQVSSDPYPPTLESFSVMGQEAKLQVFSNMLDHCSHQDQLSLCKELESRLTRDFITFLPPEIAIMVLSYLPVESLVTGLQVCRSWREVISGATPLWRTAVSEIGLSEAVVKTYLPEYGSYMGLTLVALSHRKWISSYVPDLVLAKESGMQFSESAGGYVVGEDFRTFREPDVSVPRSFEIRQVCSDGSLTTLHSFSVPIDLGVQFGPFSSISNREFVFWGSNAGWVGWSDPCSSSSQPSCKSPRMEEGCGLSRISTDSGLHLWRTNEVSYSSCVGVCACLNCGLAAILTSHTSNQDEDVYCVLLRKLTPGSSKIEEVGTCVLQLPTSVVLEDDEVFNVLLFPKECEGGVCGSHYLLLVVCVPNHHVSMHLVPAESSYADSENCVLSTIEIPAELIKNFGWGVYHPSSDGSVVTVRVDDEEYRVWEPDSGRIVRLHFPTDPKCRFCLAVGKLYSILGGWDAFAVVETYTGVVLLSGNTVDDLEFRPPIDQSWLSTFDTRKNISIVTLWSNSIAESTRMGSVVARRGNSNTFVKCSMYPF